MPTHAWHPSVKGRRGAFAFVFAFAFAFAISASPFYRNLSEVAPLLVFAGNRAGLLTISGVRAGHRRGGGHGQKTTAVARNSDEGPRVRQAKAHTLHELANNRQQFKKYTMILFYLKLPASKKHSALPGAA